MQRIAAADADRLAKRIVAHHSFPGASHAAIERVLNLGEIQQFDHGATLCAEGQPGNDLFFLGSVALSLVVYGSWHEILVSV